MAHAAYGAELVTKLCAPRQLEPAVYDTLATFLDLLIATGPAPSVCGSSSSPSWARSGSARRSRPAPAAAAIGSQAGPSPKFPSAGIPDRGGAVCLACARGGRPLSATVRETLVRLARTPLAEAAALPLPPDLNRDCREALLEIVNHHISGPLKSIEFIAKLSSSGGLS